MSSSSVEPLVSVVMSNYNGLAYLPVAVESILQQTHQNLEFIIIDDASTDGSLEHLKSYNDPRIVLVEQQQNQGLGAALHTGVAMAKGDYIARMDSDDIAQPERLARQVKFLAAHPDYGMLGTHYQLLDADGNKGRTVRIPLTDDELRFRAVFAYPFCHPTVMYRTSMLRQHNLNYNPACRRAQDYELIVRLLPHTKVANLKDNLLQYRKHTGSVTAAKARENAADKLNIVAPYHRQVLTPAFIASPAYTLLQTLYIENQWSQMGKTVSLQQYAAAMQQVADAYITQTSHPTPNVVYGYAAELLLRGAVFKGKGYRKPLPLLQAVFQQRRLLRHGLRQVV